MGTTVQSIEESLSIAYVKAVVSKAGATIELVPQDYGVDVSVRKIASMRGKRMDMGVAFDCQLKSTINWEEKNNHLIYDLEVDTYNKLLFRRENSSSPCILVILCLPRDENLWLSTTDEGLILRRCCYYIHLEGNLTSNTSKIRIKIPLENKLTPSAIIQLIKKSDEGDLQ
jgi:hypothetical protein